MECKSEDGKKYCKINGRWVEIDKKNRIMNSGKIQYSKNTGKRVGVC